MLRWPFRIIATLLSVGYFWSAWDMYREGQSFASTELLQAIAQIEGISEMTTLERGGAALPFLGSPTHKATVS